VGAIANEADINSKFIGRISIYDDYSTVDLPFGMPAKTLNLLRKARVGSRMMRIQRLAESNTPESQSAPQKRAARKGGASFKGKRPAKRPQGSAA